MCGIAGVAGLSFHSREARTAVEEMVQSVARRGPDSSGVDSWSQAVLGHRRLSILDLSPAGKQPFLSSDGELGLVFNGCVYNFLELRRDLEAHGLRFRSNTDTEVLLLGYQQWGVETLVARLRGMFAFAIWDNSKRKLILVRDRLGVKPLYYAVSNGQIAFASTATALRDAGFVDQIDPNAVLEFLEFGWVSEELSIYTGARKVPAATIIEWHQGSLTEQQYWKPSEPGSRRVPFDEATDATEALLLESVQLRLIADVPIGTLLSGGIDSTLIAWALTRVNANVKAFTVSTPGHPADEAKDARETAQILGIPHEIIELDPQERPALDHLTRAYGEPFACSSALAMLRVCKAVKPNATVLLTGDGGDDVFLGYSHHRNFQRAQQVSRLMPRPVARMWPKLRPLIASVKSLRRPMHLMDYAVNGLGGVTRTHDGLPYFENGNLLGERLAGRQIASRRIPDSFESGRRLMKDFLAYEFRTRFKAEYMTKVDGASMYYAIEARSPLLDHQLWDYAGGLPVETRLRGGELKAILRELVRRNLGPRIADRKKRGFTVPVENWLSKQWRPQLLAIENGSLLEQQGWIRKGALAGAVSAAISRDTSPLQLWYLVVLENWLRLNGAKRKLPVDASGNRSR